MSFKSSKFSWGLSQKDGKPIGPSMAAEYGGSTGTNLYAIAVQLGKNGFKNRPALYGGPLIRSLRNTDLSDRTRKRRYRRSIPETNQRPVPMGRVPGGLGVKVILKSGSAAGIIEKSRKGNAYAQL
jgi:hypothetical protein